MISRQLILAITLNLAISSASFGFTASQNVPSDWPNILSAPKAEDVAQTQEERSLKSIVAFAKVLGDNLLVARACDQLAELYLTERRFAESENAYKATIEAMINVKGKKSVELALEYDRLANLYVKQDRYDLAENANAAGLNILRDTLGNHHLGVAVLLSNQAWLNARRGALVDAEKHYLACLEIFRHHTGENQAERESQKDRELIGFTEAHIAELSMKQKKYAQAERWYGLAVHNLTGILEDDQTMSELVRNYAYVLRMNHKPKTARRFETEWGSPEPLSISD